MTANAAYMTKASDVDRAIAELKNKLHRHRIKQARNKNDWGYVGDLEYIRSEIEELSKRFGG